MIYKYVATAMIAAALVGPASPAFGAVSGLLQNEFIFPVDADTSGRPEIHITAFGDSIVTGLDHDNGDGYLVGGSFVEQFGRAISRLNKKSAVLVHNRAVAGSHTSDIAEAIGKESPYVAKANYFVLDGGGNDFLDLLAMKPEEMCQASNVGKIVRRAIDNWSLGTEAATGTLPAQSKSIYLTLHFGDVDGTKKRICADGVSSPYPVILDGISQLNFHIGELARKNKATLLDAFGMFNCDPSIRENCDPQKYSSVEAYVTQIRQYDQQGLIKDAKAWKGDDQSPPRSLMQSDSIHPNKVGNHLLSYRLFKLFGL